MVECGLVNERIQLRLEERRHKDSDDNEEGFAQDTTPWRGKEPAQGAC